MEQYIYNFTNWYLPNKFSPNHKELLNRTPKLSGLLVDERGRQIDVSIPLSKLKIMNDDTPREMTLYWPHTLLNFNFPGQIKLSSDKHLKVSFNEYKSSAADDFEEIKLHVQPASDEFKIDQTKRQTDRVRERGGVPRHVLSPPRASHSTRHLHHIESCQACHGFCIIPSIL